MDPRGDRAQPAPRLKALPLAELLRHTLVVRLFAAVWPSEEAKEALRAFPREDLPGIRWTTPSQWHVTLGFFGDVPEDERPGLWAAMGRAAASLPRPPIATLAEHTELLGPAVLCVRVDGLDTLAAAVREQTLDWAKDGRPFTGHLTLARARRGVRGGSPGARDARGGPAYRAEPIPSHLVERPVGLPTCAEIDGSSIGKGGSSIVWVVDELCLVASTPGGAGSRYELVGSAVVGG